jgi:serine/threonine protein kinase
MTQNKNCAKCGNEFSPANETDSACPKCLAQFAMEPTRAASQSQSAVSDEPVLPAGTKLGQYEIKEMLGRGGMGTVYKAYQLMLDRFVAIKILPAKLFTDPEFVTRFNREAKALAGLSHPNIVGIYDIGQESGYFYFVMEFVEGVTVRQLIEERKLPPEEAMKIVPQLCEALEYAHSEGVVHRDIKPENILVDKNGRIKIADFGLARIVRGDIRIDPVTRTQEVMGTLDYMAPEQRMKSKDVDLRVDIYSLGVVFYEMLTGELPIGKFEVPSRKVQIDVRIDDIVMKTLEREPSKRYQRVSEIGSAVSQILSGASAGAKRSSRPVFVPVLIAIGLLLGAGIAFLALSKSPVLPVQSVKSEQSIIQTVEKLVLAIEISYKANFFGGNYPESVKALCEFPSVDAVVPDAKLIAQADQGALGADAKPYRGYFFRMVPYEIINQEPYFPGSPFTLAAYPANQVGQTFICDERRIIYAKDLGGLKYPDKWKSKIGPKHEDYDPTRDGWQGAQRVELTDANFISAYKKMRTAMLTPEDKAVIEKLKTSKISTDILRKPSRLKDVLDFISKELNIRIEDIRTIHQVDDNNQEPYASALWFDSADSAPAKIILKVALMGAGAGKYSYFVKYGKIIVCNMEIAELPLSLVQLEDGISIPDQNNFVSLMMDQAERIMEQNPQEARYLLSPYSPKDYDETLNRRLEELQNKIQNKIHVWLEYQEHIELGKDLMAQGKYQEALKAFTQAQSINYTPGVKVMMRQCQEEIKKLESEPKTK